MPWKNQGGGPLGSGPKGPWGSGPQSGGSKPPDLEDLLRRGQDKLQTMLPGGNFSGVGIALILVAALAIWGLSGFFRVQSEELGVVLRFGKHVRTVQPGLNYHLAHIRSRPCCCRRHCASPLSALACAWSMTRAAAAPPPFATCRKKA